MSGRSKGNKKLHHPGTPSGTVARQDGDANRPRREMMHVEAEFRGPLPPPAMLEAYEAAYPGTAKLIINRFEKEAEHRHSLQHKVVDGQIAQSERDSREATRGQWFGFIIAIVGLGGGTACILFARTSEQAGAGAVIAGATLVGIVSAFIVGRFKKPPTTNNDEGED